MQCREATNPNKAAAKTLGFWLLPVALLSLPVFVLSIMSATSSRIPHADFMGTFPAPDPVGERLAPIFPFYYLLGFVLWFALLRSGIARHSRGPSWEIWAAQAGYQLIGTLLFSYLASYYRAPEFGNVGGWKFWLYPLIVTIPALLFSSYRLYRATERTTQ
jgi:hypothetical protein